jgi:hypothetical protein
MWQPIASTQFVLGGSKYAFASPSQPRVGQYAFDSRRNSERAQLVSTCAAGRRERYLNDPRNRNAIAKTVRKAHQGGNPNVRN